MMTTIDAPTRYDRLVVANYALACFAPGTRLIYSAGVWVEWQTYRDGECMLRKWQTRGGQSFYPTWSRIYPRGGTSTTALSQLVRWVQGRRVLPLATWRRWCGDKCKLGGDRGPECVATLERGEYPAEVPCVLCGRGLVGSLDWWCLDGVSGPCCDMNEGCEQKHSAATRTAWQARQQLRELKKAQVRG